MSDYITPDEGRKLFEQVAHERVLVEAMLQEVLAYRPKRYRKLPKNLERLPVVDLSALKPLSKTRSRLPVLDLTEPPSPGDRMPADWRSHYLAELDEITNGHWKGVLITVPDMVAVRKAWSDVQADWEYRTSRGLGTTNAAGYRGIRTHMQRTGMFWSVFADTVDAHNETEGRMSTETEAVKMQSAYWAQVLDELPARLAAYSEDLFARHLMEDEVI